MYKLILLLLYNGGMFVFIDDSGDAGFKLEKGSSRHFVIACVIFDNPLDAEQTALAIKRFRETLGWSQQREFKFNKLAKRYRLAFLEAIKDQPFRVRAIVVDKKLTLNPELRENKQSFYNYIIKEVLSKSAGSVFDAKLRIDGMEDRRYKRAALTYFRQELGVKDRVISDAKFVNSSGDNLIQLADLVAGSIHRSKQLDKTDSGMYLRIIGSRVEDIWDFQ